MKQFIMTVKMKHSSLLLFGIKRKQLDKII